MKFNTLLILAVFGTIAAAQFPGTEFTAGFGYPSVAGGSARDACLHDDGAGAGIFAVGTFAFAGEAFANHVAVWRAGRWSAVGSFAAAVPGAGTIVATTAASFASGGAPNLYVGYRRFGPGASATVGVLRWDGSGWTTVGSEFSVAVGAGINPVDADLKDMLVADLGWGPRLFVGGRFNRIGAAVVEDVAQFDGTAFAPVGAGLGPMPWSGLASAPVIVESLAVSSVAGAPELYAGGNFKIGAVETRLARFDGVAWTPIVNTGMFGGAVLALRAFDAGSGEKLYVGGTFAFTPPVGPQSGGFVAYDGASFAAPAALTGPCCVSGLGVVRTLGVRSPAGAPPELVVGGDFYTVDGAVAGGLARLSGGVFGPYPGWTITGTLSNVAPAFIDYDDGDGPRLYYGVSRAFDGSAWGSIDRRAAPNLALARRVLDLGEGPTLYGATGLSIYRRAGVGWSFVAAPGPGAEGAVVQSLAAFDEGAGPRLFAAGRFIDPAASGTPRGLLRYDGSAFSNVGGAGVVVNNSTFSPSQIRVLTAADLGGGEKLYAAGNLAAFPGASSQDVAAWNGSTWSDLGTGVAGGFILDMLAFDDGTGPALYVGGLLSTAGGQSVVNVARWNGTTWSPLGSGLNGLVHDLQVHDDGAGPQLYAAGAFSQSGANPVGSVARWDGTAWISANLPFTGSTYTLESHDDGLGGGPKLYAGGVWSAGPGYLGGLARFDGGVWTAVPGLAAAAAGTAVTVWDLTSVHDVDRPALYVNGVFTSAGGAASNGIARLGPIAPKPHWSQTGSGAPVTFSVDGFPAGTELFNLFTVETTGPVALGPVFGLYAADLTPLVLQVAQPLGTEPFHVAPATIPYSVGPIPLPVGLRVDALCVSLATGFPIFSRVERLFVR